MFDLSITDPDYDFFVDHASSHTYDKVFSIKISFHYLLSKHIATLNFFFIEPLIFYLLFTLELESLKM